MASALYVKKVETESSKAWQELIKVPYLAKVHAIPKHPFRLICSGPAGTGKTNSLVWLLIQKLMYRKWFNKIVIVCPSISDCNYSVLDEIYEDSKLTEIQKYEGLDEKSLSEIGSLFQLSRSQAAELKEEAAKTLVILDDVISDKNVQRKEIKDLFFSGRHASLSVIITAQSYMAIPRSLRLNATNLFLFGLLKNESEIKRVVDEHRKAFISKEDFQNVIMDAMRPVENQLKPFLHINYQADELSCYRKGFAEIYEIEE